MAQVSTAPALGATQTATRALMLWSSAGGRVSSGLHMEALASACARGGIAFDRRRDALGEVTQAALMAALMATPDRPIVLHVLCHASQGDGAVAVSNHQGFGAEFVFRSVQAGEFLTREGLAKPQAGQLGLAVAIDYG